jgi:hypothetical protein
MLKMKKVDIVEVERAVQSKRWKSFQVEGGQVPVQGTFRTCPR